MATQSQGIQQLLAAEKKAAEIVSEARKSILFALKCQKKLWNIELFWIFILERTKRLKQAKDEAANEVEAFKAEKEKQHKILEQQVKIKCF